MDMFHLYAPYGWIESRRQRLSSIQQCLDIHLIAVNVLVVLVVLVVTTINNNFVLTIIVMTVSSRVDETYAIAKAAMQDESYVMGVAIILLVVQSVGIRLSGMV